MSEVFNKLFKLCSKGKRNYEAVQSGNLVVKVNPNELLIT